jgi:hypothetical protein
VPDCSSGRLTRNNGIKFLALKARLELGRPAIRFDLDQPFARTLMVDFVRSDGGGFLTGSMIAMLVLCAVFLVAGSFN